MAADFPSDTTLVKSWQSGNERAYGQLFDRYYNPLFHYAYRFVADRCTSEEIVMDVMLSVWKKKGSLDCNLSVSAFMYKSVRNRVIDYARKQKIRLTSLEDPGLRPSSGFKADNMLREKEIDGLYRQELERLSPRKRMIFLMSREGRESYISIANKLQISKNTVENHMVAALRHFKNRLGVALSAIN